MGYPAEQQTASLVRSFRTTFQDLGFVEQRPASIVSRVDPTVRFIGAAISTLKPMLLSDGAPSPGAFLVQPALRTRCLSELADRGSRYGWSSYFLAFGALAPPGEITSLAAAVNRFLFDALPISRDRLVLRASSHDADLINVAAAFGAPEIDGYHQANYRHRFGVDGVRGRNFNYAILTNGAPRDVGNLILIEREGTPIGAEAAFGASVLLAHSLELPHPAMASPLADHLEVESWDQIKCVNALEACVVLGAEGLRPTGRGRGRTFRTYLEALECISARAAISLETLHEAALLGGSLRVPEPIRSPRQAADAICAYLAALRTNTDTSSPVERRAALEAFDRACRKNPMS